jgi:hypothetical protein
MKPVSLANISYEQGLELLSLRKQALDSGEAKRLPSDVLRKSQMLQSIGEKTAAEGGFLNNLTGSLSNLGSSVKGSLKNMDPALKRTLLTGATGAGLGAIGGAFSDDKNRLRNMLMGGIAGGALGGGIGLASNRGLLDKAVDSAVPGLKDRARAAIGGGGGSKGPAGPAKPGQLSEFGIDITPERMAEIEANRIPNLANPLDNNLSQIEPYATGGGAIGLGAYLKNKLAPQVDDAGQIASKFTSSFIDPELIPIAREVLKDTGSKIPANALRDPKLLKELLTSGELNKSQLSGFLSAFNNMIGSNPGKKTEQAVKTLLNQLNVSKAEFEAIPTKSLGFRDAAKNVARGGKKNLLRNLKGAGKLALPAALLGYGGYRALGGAGEQIKNEVVWNKLKNRLEQVAE